MSVAEMTVGERIRAARKSAGLTQAQLAELCDVAMITIQQYEHNKRQPRIHRLEEIAAALGVSVKYFLGIPEDREERAVFAGTLTFLESLEICDTMTKEAFFYFPNVKLRQLLLDDFRKLNRRGKIEAVIRLRELTENLRFTFQEELEPDSTVTWDNPSETGETSQ